MLPVLARLPKIVPVPVAVLLISERRPESFLDKTVVAVIQTGTCWQPGGVLRICAYAQLLRLLACSAVTFQPYTAEELRAILEHDMAQTGPTADEARLWRAFLTQVTGAFRQSSCLNLLDLRQLVQPLWVRLLAAPRA